MKKCLNNRDNNENLDLSRFFLFVFFFKYLTYQTKKRFKNYSVFFFSTLYK